MAGWIIAGVLWILGLAFWVFLGWVISKKSGPW